MRTKQWIQKDKQGDGGGSFSTIVDKHLNKADNKQKNTFYIFSIVCPFWATVATLQCRTWSSSW